MPCIPAEELRLLTRRLFEALQVPSDGGGSGWLNYWYAPILPVMTRRA